MRLIYLRRRIQRLRVPHFSLIMSICFFVILLLTFWYGSLRTSYIEASFSYSADLQTTTKQYDRVNNQYGDDHHSRATYSIQPLREKDGITSVESSISMPDSSGNAQKIVTRQYDINTVSGHHAKSGMAKETGYLFAPRGIAKYTSFVHQYAPYDSPATMRYIGQESLHGLPVYVYDATFSKANHIPAPGSTAPNEALEYQPQIKLWIEPTTGWLVKLQEDTTVYSYNTATGERIAPVRHMAASFTESSVRQNIEYARHFKYRLDFGLSTVPIIILALILLLLLTICIKLALHKRLQVRKKQ